MRAPEFTLTAGPTMASPRVLAALGSPVLFDYDPVFLERFRDTERLLAELYRTSGDVVLMQGEAVLGLEAAARALVGPGTRCLNLVSGVYAAWFGDWLRAYGGDVTELRVPYDEALDPAEVERALSSGGPFDLVAIVHSETPSGIENPLREIAPLVHEHGALMLADVVSSLAGTEVAIDDWHVDVAVAGPQKCLAGPPGMSLVAVSARAWEAIERNAAAPRGSFLSLLDWKHRWIDGGRAAFPYTPSVSDVNGVHAALLDVLDDGVEASIARHALAARATRAGARGLGLELWAREESYAANCVTAVRVPDSVQVPALLAHVRERYGVMLSGGHGELKEQLVRLGHMGPASRSLYPLVAIGALGRGLADLGAQVDIGAGTAAALEVLGEGDGA
ncbi:MAG TPA: alanine--glyoxylate aminotransferase family protein [Solirubrobacteraceae bacterium]|nr:alanine--glyoxylate aminotransferase family protein [Solirubrobacteraceae bacterium]